MITSVQSDKVKFVVRLQQKARFRFQEGLFVCEGKRLVQEVPEELLQEVYIESGRLASDPGLAQWSRELTSRGVRAEEVTPEVMEKMAGVVHSQGVLAVVQKPSFTKNDLIGNRTPLLIMLDNLQDPGNMGTILRTAEAAGVTGVIGSSDSVDFYSPKVVRSTMGGIFRVPHVTSHDFVETIRGLQANGVRVYAAVLTKESKAYDEVDYTRPTAIVIGNEGAGIRKEIASCADWSVMIPMSGEVESLNAGVAAGVLLFEAARQRSRKSYADLV